MSAKDKNRFRKVYPFLRRKPVLGEDANVIVESTSITFTNTDNGTHSFTKSFTSVPFVTATAYDSKGNESANVNVFVSALTTSSVTVRTSSNFTGEVHIHAIQNLT